MTFLMLALQTVGLLIVEDPNQLVVYDQFKTRVAAPMYAAHTPFEIVSESTQLDDGITTVMALRANGLNVYFQRNADGLINRTRIGSTRRVEATPVTESYQIRDLAALKPVAADGKPVPALSNVTVIEAYRSKGRSYCRSGKVWFWVQTKRLTSIGRQNAKEELIDVVETRARGLIDVINKKLTAIHRAMRKRQSTDTPERLFQVRRLTDQIELRRNVASPELFREIRIRLQQENLRFTQTDSTLTIRIADDE